MGTVLCHPAYAAYLTGGFILQKFLTLFHDSAAELKCLPSMVIASMLMAVGLVLGSITIKVTPFLHIGVSFLANAITGLLFGPVMAMLTAGLGDIIGYFLSSGGDAFFFPFTLTAMLSGCLYGIFLYHSNAKLPRVIAAKASVTFISNILLNTIWCSILYGKGFMAIFPVRLTKNLTLLPFEIAMLFVIGKAIQKIYDVSQQHFGAQGALH